MNALELSRAFFLETALPDLRAKFPGAAEQAAAGLAGNGSECFGYDDEYSRDHDWGIDFFLWLPGELAGEKAALSAWKTEICGKIPPEYRKKTSAYGAKVGVQTVGEFFYSLMGCTGRPGTLQEWLRAPEEQLSMCVNGEIFHDGNGEFRRVQEEIRAYYPEDIRLKRIAAACMTAAQAGQYNVPRMAKRGDLVTVQTALSRFTDKTIRLIYLLNRVYRPYYKWAYRGMCALPILGEETGERLRTLNEVCGFSASAMAEREVHIEEICGLIVSELQRQGLTDETDSFLAVHGESVRKRIRSDVLRGLPAQADPFPD